MSSSSGNPPARNSFFTILIALVLFYGLGHLLPASLPTASSTFFGMTGPAIAYAEEDEEFDEEDEEDEEEEGEEEEGGEEAA